MEKIIENLKQKARESWSGETGEERAVELEKFLRTMLENYSKVLGFSQEEILKRIEKKRDYCAVNYYQLANFPLLENVEVFETIGDLRKKFPSNKFVCPSCKGISTDPDECNSGKETSKGKSCDWKSYGLFGCLDGGYNFVVKEDFLNSPRIHKIFKPVELKPTQNK